jgi:hypothetical protein
MGEGGTVVVGCSFLALCFLKTTTDKERRWNPSAEGRHEIGKEKKPDRMNGPAF